uniref:NAD(P)-binding domain-containing protein n=1 Tax=Fusarium oxysporum (strain Fo5176) TaxID=660025 RepID=A0A0D2YGF7_FUSOF
MHVAIAPASNKTSTAAISSLLSQNREIHVKGLYRDLKKVPNEFSSADNFEAIQGDVGDVNTLDFSGSDAVLMVLPPAYDGRDIIEHSQRISKVLKNTDIPEIIIIRCSYFMENWTMSVETLKGSDPYFFSTITPLDFKIAMVAIKDIGAAMATQLIRDWTPPRKPYIMELHGPEPYSPLDAQKAFSQALGEDVEVKAVEKEDLSEFYGKIFAPQIVNEWVEMSTCFLPGGIAEKDLSKPSDVDVIYGKTTLNEALREATAELRK